MEKKAYKYINMHTYMIHTKYETHREARWSSFKYYFLRRKGSGERSAILKEANYLVGKWAWRIDSGQGQYSSGL